MIIYFLAALLSLFSASVMAYISMATSIGPWISPTLLLLLYALYGLCRQKPTVSSLLGITSCASIGGIAATACGFSFPAIFFLDSHLYASLVANPYYYFLLVGNLVGIASFFGMQIAYFFENSVLLNNKYQFPVGQMIFTMAAKGHNAFQTVQLWAGGLFFTLWVLGQKGTRYGKIPAIFTTKVYDFGLVTIPAFRFDFTVLPMLVSIGFVTGHVIAKPLFVGAFARLCFLNPLHNHFFAAVSLSEFLLAFCAGMVLCGALQAIFLVPNAVKKFIESVSAKKYAISKNNAQGTFEEYGLIAVGFGLIFMAACYHLRLSLLVQVYVLMATFLCVYQMIVIGGTMGIAPLGRFATFVMLPALFLFSLDYVQLICIATFVEIAGGVAVDILFARKAAFLAGISKKYTMRMQYLGILMASVFCAAVFLLLSAKFQIGSSVLGAYKAQARALLIHAHTFNYHMLLIGICAGFVLGKCKINPSMVLGGILMPIDYSFALISGGLLAQFFSEKDQWVPFASAIFAANSLWMLVQGFC
ncbi:hypothetical protein EKK58_03985 [Candidatus Dependentiae bacterium]|nr:MAG: hypothetical protein EKK58_03985 [Candidatus Dependentiae bacterium]